MAAVAPMEGFSGCGPEFLEGQGRRGKIMIDAEVLRLRKLRNVALRSRALAKILDSDSFERPAFAGQSMFARSAVVCWTIAQDRLGTASSASICELSARPEPAARRSGCRDRIAHRPECPASGSRRERLCAAAAGCRARGKRCARSHLVAGIERCLGAHAKSVAPAVTRVRSGRSRRDERSNGASRKVRGMRREGQFCGRDCRRQRVAVFGHLARRRL